MDRKIRATLFIMGLNSRNSVAVLEDTPVNRGMIRKVQNFGAWGEVSDEVISQLKPRMKKNAARLKPPSKGLKSVKLSWQKGDLGYRGDKINDLIKRMM